MTTMEEQAKRLLKEVPLIDGHNDFPYIIRGWFRNQINGQESNLYDMPIGQTDIKRLQAGMLGGQFWSAYVPCPKDGQEGGLTQLRQTLQQIDLIHRLIETHPTVLQFADSAAGIWSSFRAGRVASLIGVEGLHQIGNSIGALRMLYRLGVRYVTLTHNCHNLFADAATSPEIHGGLSPNGQRLIGELNRMGMIIDLSHTSHKAQTQALKISDAPVIYSHSSIYTLCPHPRNVTDENLQLLQKNGGIIMICFLRDLTDPSPDSNATLARVIDHIVYAGEKIGYEHVGIGSDFDGMLQGPDGLHDVSCYPALVAGLLQRGVSELDVKKVMGLNIIRVLEEVESVAQRRSTRDCLWDEYDEVWNDDIKEKLLRERERGRLLSKSV